MRLGMLGHGATFSSRNCNQTGRQTWDIRVPEKRDVLLQTESCCKLSRDPLELSPFLRKHARTTCWGASDCSFSKNCPELSWQLPDLCPSNSGYICGSPYSSMRALEHVACVLQAEPWWPQVGTLIKWEDDEQRGSHAQALFLYQNPYLHEQCMVEGRGWWSR